MQPVGHKIDTVHVEHKSSDLSVRRININDIVSVRLTDAGYDHLIKSDNGINAPLVGHSKFNKATREFRIELWELFSIFCDQMYMGNTKQVFINNDVVLS